MYDWVSIFNNSEPPRQGEFDEDQAIGSSRCLSTALFTPFQRLRPAVSLAERPWTIAKTPGCELYLYLNVPGESTASLALFEQECYESRNECDAYTLHGYISYDQGCLR